MPGLPSRSLESCSGETESRLTRVYPRCGGKMIKRRCELCGKITAYTGALVRLPGFYRTDGTERTVNPCFECGQKRRIDVDDRSR